MGEKMKTVISVVEGESTSRDVITRALLATVAIAGLITMIAVAPNAIQALPFFGIGRRSNDRKYYIKTRIEKLCEKGYLARVRKNGVYYFELTKSGRIKLAKLNLAHYEIKKGKWDGLWRLVMFDIKEIRRDDRDMFRIQLERLDFCRLQNSVWVTPYDCGDLIVLLKTEFSFGWQVVYAVAKHIENDRQLREYFGVE
jgi:DNA-binding transcriptional regulator PaaX